MGADGVAREEAREDVARGEALAGERRGLVLREPRGDRRALVQRAGGGVGLAKLLTSYLTSASRCLASAYALCCMIFFDDYSSVLIVGSSLRPVLPSLSVPPERLAIIVHTMGVILAAYSIVYFGGEHYTGRR